MRSASLNGDSPALHCCRYEKVEQQKQSLKKAAELERRFATKDGAGPDGAADGAAASSDSDSDQDDEDKITETEEAGECGL